MGKVKIKNIINRAIIFAEPELKLRREVGPNQSFIIDAEKLEEAMNYPGISIMFKRGYLRVESEANEELNDMFGDMDINLEDNKKSLSVDEFKKIIENGTDYELKVALEGLSKERISVVVSAAMKATGLTGSKIDLIEKYTGKNIYKLKALQKEME